jgi:hypothetical protein
MVSADVSGGKKMGSKYDGLSACNAFIGFISTAVLLSHQC